MRYTHQKSRTICVEQRVELLRATIHCCESGQSLFSYNWAFFPYTEATRIFSQLVLQALLAVFHFCPTLHIILYIYTDSQRSV